VIWVNGGIKYNHPGGDYLAQRKGNRYFITVKARNKYVYRTRRLNGGYNIFPAKVRAAAKRYGAIPSWVMIQLDTEKRRYSAYFGTIDSLRNPNAVAVPMSPRAVSIYECLASERFDTSITPDLSNQLTEQGTDQNQATFNLQAHKAERQLPRKAMLSPPAKPTFEDHVEYTDRALQSVLRELRARIIALDPSGRRISEQVTAHQRIAYSVARIFAEIKVQRKRILIRFFGMGVSDPRSLVTNIPAMHRWQQDKQIAVDSFNALDYAMTFIEASYRSHLTTTPVR
jgi:predicted transport protein